MGFDTFLGNPQAVAALREMLRSGRLQGSFLFSGPEGVGKKTLATMVAKARVCERLKDDFCGECARCRKAEEMFAAAREDMARRREIKEAARRVEGLVYFDFQLIEPITRYILTEQIRQIRNVAYTRPFEFAQRIFIIDQAQWIHWQAVDLLLKVLEEPPETTTFILVCPNAFELRPTIRSRCLRIPFLPVDEPTILSLLARNKELPRAQSALAARLAAGSVARALSFDPREYELRRRPWVDFLDAVARPAPGSASLDWQQLSAAARTLAENREEFDQTLEIGYTLLRDLLQVLQGSVDAEVANLDLLPRLKAWASKLGWERLEQLKTGLDQAHRLQIRNVNPQLGFETLAMDLAAIPPANPHS